MTSQALFPRVLLGEAVEAFEYIARNVASHTEVMDERIYPQPHVYLTSHLVCMWVAGWRGVDFDGLAAVSGASALFAYEPGSFMPKYALLHIGIDERIANATGFGWEWVPFEGADGAWQTIVESVDAGRPLKGWHAENILFAGYQDATPKSARRIFVMTDGADYFAEWWSWSEFEAWVQAWSHGQLGRHTAPVSQADPQQTALRVMEDLIAWAEEPPQAVREHFPRATFGLAGVAAYATDCADSDTFADWSACHDINPQWTVRNATAAYLEDVGLHGLFALPVSEHISAAAMHYRAAYAAWREFYRQVGYLAPQGAGRVKARRLAAAAAIQKALEQERAGIQEIRHALDGVQARLKGG